MGEENELSEEYLRRDKMYDDLYEMKVENQEQFRDVVVAILKAWRERIFNEGENFDQQQDVWEYVEGMRGVIEADFSFEDEYADPKRQPNWNDLRHLMIRSFGHS